jgi:hypothetical protein
LHIGGGIPRTGFPSENFGDFWQSQIDLKNEKPGEILGTLSEYDK